MNFLLRMINFLFVMAGRVRPDDDIGSDEKPMYGFCWWVWIPEINHNGARLFNNNQCFDFSILFLCFSIGFILWPISATPKNYKWMY